MVTFTEEILNGKLNLLCSVSYLRWNIICKYDTIGKVSVKYISVNAHFRVLQF